MEQIGSMLTNIFKPDGASAASSATPPEPAAAPAAAAADAPVVIAVIGAFFAASKIKTPQTESENMAETGNDS